MQQIEFRAMACQMLGITASDSAAAAAALADLPAWFEAWEQCLSRFRPDSELSRLNRSQGEWFGVSATLWAVLQAALDAARASDGLVTPTVLDALEAIGYGRSFEVIRTSIAAMTVAPAADIADWRGIALDDARLAARLPPGGRLDLGGVAKGWAADEAARRLAVFGPALVDAGGDIAVQGVDAADEPFPVGVADPWRPGQQLALIALGAGGVATSGRDYRRWWVNGVAMHHILDPRTGRPAQTDVLSATVVAPSARIAEVAAKAALIQGSAGGLAWIEARPELAAIVTLADGRVIESARFAAQHWQ